ncbi:hypothetical protein ISN45_At03g029020 [Arabidopsis thaliana x Arabidopsis arenosa]|uniref:Uncharacterized protein n=2 Tax=Arabidopsis TaxID=3701 RepID=A0A8T2F8Z3_ARASU|nr:hypothetical protein ISN45_At03g029020 [Arabidopsis thaliana x Arabidopsis arenosa]KAG7632765.1 hypothetical protein ISN44_As03g028640 [Arabidopsis suecica]
MHLFGAIAVSTDISPLALTTFNFHLDRTSTRIGNSWLHFFPIEYHVDYQF